MPSKNPEARGFIATDLKVPNSNDVKYREIEFREFSFPSIQNLKFNSSESQNPKFIKGQLQIDRFTGREVRTVLLEQGEQKELKPIKLRFPTGD